MKKIKSEKIFALITVFLRKNHLFLRFFFSFETSLIIYTSDGEPLLYGGSKNDSFLKLTLSGSLAKKS